MRLLLWTYFEWKARGWVRIPLQSLWLCSATNLGAPSGKTSGILHGAAWEPEWAMRPGLEATLLDHSQGNCESPGQALFFWNMCNIFTNYLCSFQNASTVGTVPEGSMTKWRAGIQVSPASSVPKKPGRPPASGKVAQWRQQAGPVHLLPGLRPLNCDMRHVSQIPASPFLSKTLGFRGAKDDWVLSNFKVSVGRLACDWAFLCLRHVLFLRECSWVMSRGYHIMPTGRRAQAGLLDRVLF